MALLPRKFCNLDNLVDAASKAATKVVNVIAVVRDFVQPSFNKETGALVFFLFFFFAQRNSWNPASSVSCFQSPLYIYKHALAPVAFKMPVSRSGSHGISFTRPILLV